MTRLVEQAGSFLDLTPNVVWTGVVVFAALAIGTAIRAVTLRGRRDEKALSLWRRNRTWWIIAATVAAAVALGVWAVVLLFAAVSTLAIREDLAILRKDGLRPAAPAVLYAVCFGQYALLLVGWWEAALVFVPVAGALAITLPPVLAGNPEHFAERTGASTWGMLAAVYFVSHAPMLAVAAPGDNPAGGWAGWLLYLLILTELNDIMQAIVGRRFGKHKIIPRISPGKSWEGLAGGAICTAAAAAALAPLLTPLAERQPGLPEALRAPYVWAVAAGLFIAVAGFVGDITVSALKREAGVKDSGTLLPGQGGILDRVDSLLYTAPIFFYTVLIVQGSAGL